ncbi:hypothetical protein ACA910_022589 [Epithemia clementina (nom. ined.)]
MRDSEILFEHLSLGRVISRTTTLFLDRAQLYMTLTGLVVIPAALFGALIGAIWGLPVVRAAAAAAAAAQQAAMDTYSNNDDPDATLVRTVTVCCITSLQSRRSWSCK